MSVAGEQGILNGDSDLVGLALPGTEPDLGHLRPGVQGVGLPEEGLALKVRWQLPEFQFCKAVFWSMLTLSMNLETLWRVVCAGDVMGGQSSCKGGKEVVGWRMKV